MPGQSHLAVSGDAVPENTPKTGPQWGKIFSQAVFLTLKRELIFHMRLP